MCRVKLISLRPVRARIIKRKLTETFLLFWLDIYKYITKYSVQETLIINSILLFTSQRVSLHLLLLELLVRVLLVGVEAPGVADPGIVVRAGGAGGEVPDHVKVSLRVGQGTFVRGPAGLGWRLK